MKHDLVKRGDGLACKHCHQWLVPAMFATPCTPQTGRKRARPKTVAQRLRDRIRRQHDDKETGEWLATVARKDKTPQ